MTMNDMVFKTAQYLQNICSLLSCNLSGKSVDNVIYNMRNECAHLEEEGPIKHPKSLFGKHVRCPYCFTVWKDGLNNLVLAPLKKRTSLKKLLKKDPEKLNEYQRKFIKSINRQKSNCLILKCAFCEKCTKLPLIKPVDKKPLLNPNISGKVCPHTETKIKKKKKRKDIFAGLNLSAVAHVKSGIDVKATPKKRKNNSESMSTHLVKKLCSNDSLMTDSSKNFKLNCKSVNNSNIKEGNSTKSKKIDLFSQANCPIKKKKKGKSRKGDSQVKSSLFLDELLN